MGKYNTSPDVVDALFERIEALESTVRTLATARRIGDTAIDRGALIVRGGALIAEDIDGSQLLYIGQGSNTTPGSGQAFMRLSRANGKAFFSMHGNDADDQYWVWLDQSGNSIIGDDIVSGQGLARPYIPYTAVATREMLTPSEITNTDQFKAAWSIHGVKQHPRVRVLLYITRDAGTNGEIQIRNMNDESIVVPPTALGSNPWTFLTGEVSGTHMSLVRLDVDIRRTSGSGNIRSHVLYTYGIQS